MKMKDYSAMLNEEIIWKSDAEIMEFEHNYKNYIHNVLREKNVDEPSRQVLYDDILIKFGQGKLNYDASVGKFETFLYHIVQNTARDFFREKMRHDERHVEVTEQNTATLFDLSHGDNVEFEYFRSIAVETLKRLCKTSHAKKENIEIFTKRCFDDASIQELADEYNKKKSEISLIVSRLHTKYKTIFREVWKEMDAERMKESRISIDFLSPIMDFSLSVA